MFELLGGPPTANDLVKARPFKITRAAVVGGGAFSAAAVIGEIIDLSSSVHLPAYPLAIVIAAGVLAAALAATADVLARAWIQVNTPTTTTADSTHVKIGAYELSGQNGDLKIHTEPGVTPPAAATMPPVTAT